MDLTERHPSTRAALRRLEPNPNLPPEVLVIANEFHDFGTWLAERVVDDPDLSDGLRKLWEAKNCIIYLAVRPPEESS
jgi:hypothetical protein